ncbi:MAG TPA: hypothetical protein VFU97_18655 [Xanthobacteraceae bacterium]|jgi:hypothetical protein|nr:hypothetical protein [Xanthobacteraceae bacterium]
MPDEIASWITFEWLPLGLVVCAGTVPAAIAHARGWRLLIWLIYGVAAALFAWPLVLVPTVHALFTRPRLRFISKEDRERRRRADALALIREPSLRTYRSRIKELRRTSPAGVDRRRYVYASIQPGDALELVREADLARNAHATAYYHRGVHLGYLPRGQSWVAEALDDGLRLAVIVERVKTSWLSRRRARSVRTRLVMLRDRR